MNDVKIAPSLLAADFSKLSEEIARIEDHVDWLHLDVMDGHFVPNVSFGIPIIQSIRGETSLYFDCHIMTTNPDAYVSELAAAGVDLVTMHIEAIPDPNRGGGKGTVQRPQLRLGAQPGDTVRERCPVRGDMRRCRCDVGGTWVWWADFHARSTP